MDSPSPLQIQARLARTVRDALATAGISQSRLAELTGIPQSTISRKLSGLGNFTIPELHLIAFQLGMPMSDLIETMNGAA